MYKIEVLIATMHKENKEDIVTLLNDMNINSNAVVVSQCDKNGVDKFEYRNHNITCIYSTERGLSRSRNLALQHATADIVMIADDDMRYNDDYAETVITAYTSYPEFDIMTFKIKDYKKYFSVNKRLNALLIHKVSSVEITMKLSSVRNISFNVLFGTGSLYFQHGEEVIFLQYCIKKKKRIMFIPQEIAYLLECDKDSTWFKGFNKEFMIDQGAMYYDLSRFLVFLYILQYAVRKYRLYKEHISFLSAIHYMFLGTIKYKKLLNTKL